MVLYLLLFGLGMSPIPWAINSEIYPMRVRSACVGIGTMANWIANFVVSATFLSLQVTAARGARAQAPGLRMRMRMALVWPRLDRTPTATTPHGHHTPRPCPLPPRPQHHTRLPPISA